MSLREKFFSNKPPVKDAPPVKTHGWERVGYVLKQHWVKLIGLNLLYLLCCLPIVTIPVATCAMHRVILNMVRETSYEEMLPVFFREFRCDFLRRTLFGWLLMVAPFSLSWYPYAMGSQSGYVAVLTICMVIYFCISKYFYPMLVLLDVSIWDCFKNACIMALVEWRTTVQLLLTAGLIDLMLLLFTWQAVPLYVIILCAFNCLLGCSFVNEPFEKYFEQ